MRVAMCVMVAGLFVSGIILSSVSAGEGGKANAAEKRAAGKARAEEAREKGKARKEAVQDKVEARVDKRQDNQAKRIEHGIKKGYLTADEVNKLQTQQKAIADLETTVMADGKVTKAEAASIRDALNDASRCIWAEKHDTDGNQMPTYRFGKNVFAKNDLTTKLANENLSPDEAKALMKDFKRLTELKRKLATEDLSDADRAALQTEYNNLLNQYFEVR